MKIKTKENIKDFIDDEFNGYGLSPVKDYILIGITDEYYRIINDIGDPVLYPYRFFEEIEDPIPDNWIREDFQEGEFYIDPPELSGRGFYEDYFDGKNYAVIKLKEYLARRMR